MAALARFKVAFGQEVAECVDEDGTLSPPGLCLESENDGDYDDASDDEPAVVDQARLEAVCGLLVANGDLCGGWDGQRIE